MARFPGVIVFAAFLVTIASPVRAGDMFWSPVADLAGVNDFAVCGTTVYAATATGLFRSNGDPEHWHQLRAAGATLVACSESRVIWEESVGLGSVVYVSHDALQSMVAANGLDDAISRGLRDLAIAGDTALVATLWGVDRSTDGGLNFPAAYPVLWESSAGYQITAVWTDGTACAAAGSGGFAGQGIWFSTSGESGTWSLVLSTGGQKWLSGSGPDTIVSGDLYSAGNDPGYISTNGGASWSQLPLSWGSVAGHYQRPFVSGTRILSRHVWEEFDPVSGQFITHTDGPLFYDTAGGWGNDMDGGLPSEEELRNQAIVEGPDPYLLVAERDGAVWWFRSPGGWPPTGFDFTPPLYPAVNSTPRVTTTPPTTGVAVAPSAVGATWMYIQEVFDFLSLSYGPNGFEGTLSTVFGPSTGGWVSYATGMSWEMYPGRGTHTFYAWFADDSGNMTDPSVISGSTNFPETLQLGSGQVWGTWMYARGGESFTIGGNAPGGDLDVYHWEPGSLWCDDWAATWDNDTLIFTADTTGYHLIVLWNYPGASFFDGVITAQPAAGAVAGGLKNTKPAQAADVEAPPDEPLPFYQSPVATLIFGDGFEDGTTGQWGSS